MTDELPMIERVAAAIKAARDDFAAQERAGIEMSVSLDEALARAAITAMREPTYAMLNAAVRADIPIETIAEDGQLAWEDVCLIWEPMIDAALEDEPQ